MTYIIKYDARIDVWIGRCLEIDVQSQGETEFEALEAVIEAVELYLKHKRQSSVS